MRPLYLSHPARWSWGPVGSGEASARCAGVARDNVGVCPSDVVPVLVIDGHPVVRGIDQSLEGYDRVYVDDPFGNRIELMDPKS